MSWFSIRTGFTWACLCVFQGKAIAQNLVSNPSFETYISCPKTLGNLEDDLVTWQAPTNGSTDYFNGCSQAMGTPKNFNGEQPANFGVGYVGLYFYAPEDYREYIQAKLLQTLKKGETYKISFYVSLAERSDFAIKEFGIQFSENPVNVNTTKTLSRMHLTKVSGDTSNYFEIGFSTFYSDKKDWVLVEKEFVAKGTENYLIIGNFKNNKRTQKFKTLRNSTKGSYYYLDMVSITSVAENSPIETEDISITETDSFEIDKINVFSNVLFEFDRFELLPTAETELKRIEQYLNNNPQLKITISGHTDNLGSDNYNKTLSEERAKSVSQYLTNQGISPDRISHKGYGSSKPIASNTTSQGRSKNRRVEFVITN